MKNLGNLLEKHILICYYIKAVRANSGTDIISHIASGLLPVLHKESQHYVAMAEKP